MHILLSYVFYLSTGGDNAARNVSVWQQAAKNDSIHII